MYLQLNLSNQLAKQWKTPLSDALPETHPLLRWRVDKMKPGRKTANYVCVNEASLFSFVLAGTAGIKAAEIQQLIVSRMLNLPEIFTFPLYCFSNEVETARLPISDLMLLRQGLKESVELKQANPEDIFKLNRLSNLLTETTEGFLSANPR